MIYTEHEYLCHHGVDGQKHGVRNGPPYPLKLDQMTSVQKRKNANEEQVEEHKPTMVKLKKKKKVGEKMMTH